MPSDGRHGRPWRRARAQLFGLPPFTEAARPDVCWICGHAVTTDADHDPPLVVLLALDLDPCDLQYLRRAHGSRCCPTCGRKCNQEKGSMVGYQPAEPSSRDW